MRIECPTCQAAFEVPDARIADGAQLRCGRCGQTFGAEAARAVRAPVPPPEVIYVKRNALPPAQGPVAAGQWPVSGMEQQVPTHEAIARPGYSPLGDPPPSGDPPLGHSTSEAPIGAPPPYVPAGARGAPPPALMSSAAAQAGSVPGSVPGSVARPESPANIRVTSVLGPPPPYRPIAGVPQGFARGPAADLEAWREDALTRAPAPRPPRDAASHWDMVREPEPVPETEAPVPRAPGVPVPWPYADRPPPPPMFGATPFGARRAPRFLARWRRPVGGPVAPGLPQGIRRFPARRALVWTAVVVGLALAGGGLILHRANVMPGATRISAWLDLGTAPR